MKAKYTMMMLAMITSVGVMAQEIDDMYFNSKDRVVVKQANDIALAKRYQQEDMNAVRTRPVNPSDSYSGRGVNPEFNAQPKNGTSVIQDDPDYFVSNYQPKSVNKNLYNGSSSSAYNNCNCGFNNPYYGMGGYSGFGSPYGMYSPYSSMYGMYSPYSMYSPYGMGMYSPYSMMGGMYSPYGYSSGLSMMMGYGMGYGMYSGLSYGFGSMYSPYGYGYPMYGGTTVVNVDSRTTTHGRRVARTSGVNNYVDTRPTGVISDGGTRGRTTSGRVSSQPDYYDRSWRNNSDNFTRSSFSGSNDGGSRSWGNSWDNNGIGGAGRTRSSSFDSFGGGSGTRSSFGSGGFSGGGGSVGGGGHSRGRN